MFSYGTCFVLRPFRHRDLLPGFLPSHRKFRYGQAEGALLVGVLVVAEEQFTIVGEELVLIVADDSIEASSLDHVVEGYPVVAAYVRLRTVP